MMFREEHAKKPSGLPIGAQNMKKEIETWDSRGFVKIIQQGPYFGKMGLIIKQLESSSKQKWYLLDIEGLEVGLPENMIEMAVKK